jgi:hypothetical protein
MHGALHRSCDTAIKYINKQNGMQYSFFKDSRHLQPLSQPFLLHIFPDEQPKKKKSEEQQTN